MAYEVDPEMEPILAAMRARMAQREPMTAITPEAMRLRAAADFAPWNEGGPAVGQVRDLTLDTRVGALQARLYTPEDDARACGLLIYFHGGGWVIGDLESEDRACRELARESGAQVLSVAYRLAPEHKFPAPVLDCAAAMAWARANAVQLDWNGRALAMGGASAGANLALGAVVAMMQSGETLPDFLALLYGAFEMKTESESYRLFGSGDFGLSQMAMAYFMQLYLSDPADHTDPRAAPLLADLSGAPPCFIAIAGLDPLRDDSRRLAEKLAAAQVEEYPGVIHGFTQFARVSSAARRAFRDAGAAIKAALGRAEGRA